MNPAAKNGDLSRDLSEIACLAEQAFDALVDEREADMIRYIVALHTHAASALHLVNTW